MQHGPAWEQDAWSRLLRWKLQPLFMVIMLFPWVKPWFPFNNSEVNSGRLRHAEYIWTYQLSVSLSVRPWLLIQPIFNSMFNSLGVKAALKGFSVAPLTTAKAVTFYIPVVLKLFSPVGEWADWQIGDTSINMQVHVSAESGSDELCVQSKHLGEICCHEIWGGIITCYCPALFHFSFLVLSWFESPLVGGEPVCCIHLILHDVKKMYPEIILCWVFLAFSNCMVAGCLSC